MANANPGPAKDWDLGPLGSVQHHREAEQLPAGVDPDHDPLGTYGAPFYQY